MKIIRFLRNPPRRLVFFAALFSLFGLIFAGAYSWVAAGKHKVGVSVPLQSGMQGIKAAQRDSKPEAPVSSHGGTALAGGHHVTAGAGHYSGPGDYVVAPAVLPYEPHNVVHELQADWSDIGPEDSNDGPPSSLDRGGFSLASSGGAGGALGGGGIGGGGGGGGAPHCKKPHDCPTSSLPGDKDGEDLPGHHDDSTPVTTPVPEPETYATLLAGLFLMAALARRRRHEA